MVNTNLYTRYERFWHWLQTALITILLVTGFEVDGLHTLLGYKTAVEAHNFVGLAWLIAFAFFPAFSHAPQAVLAAFAGQAFPLFVRENAC